MEIPFAIRAQHSIGSRISADVKDSTGGVCIGGGHAWGLGCVFCAGDHTDRLNVTAVSGQNVTGCFRSNVTAHSV